MLFTLSVERVSKLFLCIELFKLREANFKFSILRQTISDETFEVRDGPLSLLLPLAL